VPEGEEGSVPPPRDDTDAELEEELDALDIEELDAWIDERSEELRSLLAPHREGLLVAAWSALGPDGIVKLFVPMRRFGLEDFLRTFKTPMPRRPAKADAVALFRKGKSEAHRRVPLFLDFLGSVVAHEAIDAFMEEDSTELEALRQKYSDSIIAAALIGRMYGKTQDHARVVLTLAGLELLPAELAADPAIIGHAHSIDAAVDELALRSIEEEMDTEAEQASEVETVDEIGGHRDGDEPAGDGDDWIEIDEMVSVEQFAAGLLAAQLDDLEDLDQLIGGLLERYEFGATAARSLALSFEAAELPDPDALETVHDVIGVLLSLVKAVQPTLDHLALPGMPPLGLVENAVIKARQGGTPSVVPRRRMADISGPPALEGQLEILRDAAIRRDPELEPFLGALEVLIDAGAREDADHLALHDLETAARDLDPERQFSAVLIAAVRGALGFPGPESAPEKLASSEEDEDGAPGPEEPVQDAQAEPENPADSEEPAADPAAAAPEGTGIATSMIREVPLKPESAHAHSPGPVETAPVERSTRTVGGVGTLVEGQINAAIDTGRFGLAAWAADAIEQPSALLHLATLAMAVREPRGRLVDALSSAHLETIDNISGGRPAQLACWASALQAAVLAPESGISELAERLVSMLNVPGAAALTETVVHFARRNVSLAGSALSTVGDLADLEETIAQRAGDAAAALQTRRYRFAVASAIWIDWTRADGALGTLNPAAADVRSRVAEVRGAARRLSDRRTVERELADAERRVRMKNSTKRTEGSTRQHLLSHAAEAVTTALAWCDAVDALAARRRLSSGADDDAVSEVHQGANRARAELFSGLEAAGPGGAGARLVLDGLYELLSGTPLADTEMAPSLVRHEALLYGDQALGIDLEPLGPLDPAAIMGGTRTLGQAFDMRREQADFVVAHALIEVAGAKMRDDVPNMEAAYALSLAEGRALVRERGDETARVLDRARRQLYVSEDTYASLSGRQARAADPERLDVDHELAELEVIAAELGAAKTAAVATFKEDVAPLCATNPDFASRVGILIDAGDLATATELVQLAERGEDLAEAEHEAFTITSFFPAIPAALPKGIDDALVAAVAARSATSSLDFSALNEATAATVSEAFEAWRRFGSGTPASQVLDVIKPVLRLMGVEAGGEDRRGTGSIASSPQRRWFDLTKVTLTGKALLPFFGSTSAGRLRCLWVTGSPSPDTLSEWVEQDPARQPVMVLHPGTMTAENRLALARKLRSRETQPVVVVDDAVIAWLSSRAEFRFDPLMGSTLPFSAGNPYFPPSGDCPREMFYGRSAQVAAVQARDGTCLVYGGRQLGKSALLRTAQREFNSVHDQVAIYVDLKAPVDAANKADAVWGELVAKLTQAAVMPTTRTPPKDPAGAVATAVNDWLDVHETGRLLVLLDETDQYFDLDAQTNFVTTSRLKDLMDAKGRRFKVVWTGLHQVRRFATVSNHPIAHLGAPAVIGYLEPGPAYRLIEQPCAALGLRFANDALVNRVLAYCNYQPVLLHLFGQALIDRMCTRNAGALRSVPIEVGDADVEAVWDSHSLQEAVREKLRLTLELDPRYKVITYTAAHEAHSRGQAVALSAPELKAAAERWWPGGFSTVDASEFRSLLEELVGLGVLSVDPDTRGWRLRSANVLRLLGTLEQVEDTLLEEEVREPQVLETSEIRDRLAQGGRSPITLGQLSDLIGTGSNQIRLIVGSEATAAGRLAEALTQAAAEIPHRFTFANPRTKAQYKRALEVGGTDLPHLVLSDLRTARAETCAEAVELARGVLPWKGTRSVALLVDASTMSWWLPYATAEGSADVGLVSLRRLDRRAARAWATVLGDVFQDEESRRQLLEVTGGWPALVERVDALASGSAARTKSSPSTAAVLGALRTELAEDPDLDDLLVSTLAGAPAVVDDVFGLLAENPTETMTPEDLSAFIQNDCANPEALIGALRTLGVLRVADDGELGAEPVLARAWAQVRAAALS